MVDKLPLFLGTAVVAGVLAAAAMEVVLWVIGTAGWAKADMLVALGSLLTGKRENARKVGLLIHVIAGAVFAVGYTYAMVRIGYTSLPQSLWLGLGIGFLHGLIVSLSLVWVVAENHPLEEFREADLAIGLSHIVGHVVYGAVVGFVVGFSPL